MITRHVSNKPYKNKILTIIFSVYFEIFSLMQNYHIY